MTALTIGVTSGPTKLFGVSPTDPMVLSAAIAVVMVVVVVVFNGALIPAVRASMLEPMRVLRDR